MRQRMDSTLSACAMTYGYLSQVPLQTGLSQLNPLVPLTLTKSTSTPFRCSSLTQTLVALSSFQSTFASPIPSSMIFCTRLAPNMYPGPPIIPSGNFASGKLSIGSYHLLLGSRIGSGCRPSSWTPKYMEAPLLDQALKTASLKRCGEINVS